MQRGWKRADQAGRGVTGPIFPEPVRVLAVESLGRPSKLIGQGLNTTCASANPTAGPDCSLTFTRRRSLLTATRNASAWAWKHGAWVWPMNTTRTSHCPSPALTPLPHQLEAVYDYFLKLPRIRFLLADDPGAGKTIMAGLLLKELKTRGLITRTLIVTPANLTFQWQTRNEGQVSRTVRGRA